MDPLFILNIFLGVAALVYLFIHRKLQYWKNLHVPFVEPEFFFGNARSLGRDVSLSEFSRRIYVKLKSLGPAGGFYIFIQPVLMITDLELLKQILVKDFHVFPNRDRYFNERDDPLTANLLNLEDDEWKNLRHKLTPTFTSGKIKMMFELVSQKADKLVETIAKEAQKSKSSVEIKIVLSRFTTDVIASTAFGIESNTLEDKSNKFLEIGLKAFEPPNFMKRLVINRFKNLSRKLGICTISKEISNFYLDVVQRTIQYRQKNPNDQRNDFMSLLMKLQDPSLDDPLTFHQIAAQSFIFFLAGYETSSTALTYCLYELSQNQEIQEKARESVKEALKNHDNILTYEAVNDMEYLEQCVNESLRKFPPAAATARVAKEDYEIPNTKIVIKKGTAIHIPIYGIHRDPEIYPEPEKFDPDSFTKEETVKRHNFAFLPFGEGPRVCIGLRFAIIEMKIALAKILTSFTFDLDRSKTSVPMKIAPERIVIMSPAEGICINFRNLWTSK